MDMSAIRRKLEIRALFYRGLYDLMTAEERNYFWVKEVTEVFHATDASTLTFSPSSPKSPR